MENLLEIQWSHVLSQFPFVFNANFLILIVTVPVTAMDLFVWDPGIGFVFMALTGYIENVEELLLLGCTDKFFLIAYSNPMRSVYKVKVVHSVGYTLYKIIKIVELVDYIVSHDLVRKSFTVNQKEHDCNWWLSILRRDLVEDELLQLLLCTSSAFEPPFDPNSSLGEILSIPILISIL
ncbi:hypothetical protein H5410_047023 [Solanum commersonii]|uniref:Uncharacterized protein n=1 Tax=Solanum commersonii TaxID=4109 RepID=A0A9J5XFX6_SOLCO|nr:hypothetical protein H5410_047023 [Solanum commersonii]